MKGWKVEGSEFQRLKIVTCNLYTLLTHIDADQTLERLVLVFKKLGALERGYGFYGLDIVRVFIFADPI